MPLLRCALILEGMEKLTTATSNYFAVSTSGYFVVVVVVLCVLLFDVLAVVCVMCMMSCMCLKCVF